VPETKIRLLASLRELVNASELTVEADEWRQALIRLRNSYPRLAGIIMENGEPAPGYLVFVDGVDYRLIDEKVPAKEIVILPITHGGSATNLEWVSWVDIEEIVENLSASIKDSGYNVDVIIGILRGGVIPAKLLADKLGVDDLGVMEVKLYTSIGERRSKPYLRQPLTLPVRNLNVLIVDDVSDTGLTLEFAVNAVQLYSPSSIKTATLYIKPWTKMVPDYYGRVSENWLVFPWERNEVRMEMQQG